MRNTRQNRKCRSSFDGKCPTAYSWYATAICAATSLLVVACSGTGPEVDESSEEAGLSVESDGSTETLPNLEGETLSVWTAPGHDAQEAAMSAFEDATGVDFDIQILGGTAGFESEIQTKWAAGDRPDLLAYHAGPTYLKPLQGQSTLYDLSEEQFVDKLLPFMRESMTVDGQIFGAPLQYPSLFSLWYNKPVLNGLSLEPPTNHRELLETCRRIKREESDVVPILTTGGDGWVPIMLTAMYWADAVKNGLAERILDGEATLEDPAIVEGFSAFKELVDEGCFNEDLQTAALQQRQGDFIDGKYAMLPLHAGIFPSVMGAEGVDQVDEAVGQAPISLESPTPSYFLGCCDTFYVPKTGDEAKEKAALIFIRWITNEHYATFIEHDPRMPIYDGFDVPQGIPQAEIEAAEILESGDAVLALESALPASYGDLPTVLSEVIAEEKTPTEAAASLRQEFERNARAIGLSGF